MNGFVEGCSCDLCEKSVRQAGLVVNDIVGVEFDPADGGSSLLEGGIRKGK